MGAETTGTRALYTKEELSENVHVPAVVEQDLKRIISDRLKQCGMYHRVFSRIKTPASMARKFELKDYGEGRKLQDLVGVRINLYFDDDVDICKHIMENTFEVIEWSTSQRSEDEFKPTKLNGVFRLPEYLKAEISPATWEMSIDDTFEIQIKTMFFEGWHEIEHDMRYKGEELWSNYPGFSRHFNSILATLELCDKSIVTLFEDLGHELYKAGQWNDMIRSHFRIKLDDVPLYPEVEQILNEDQRENVDSLAKRIYKTSKETLIRQLLRRVRRVPLNANTVVALLNDSEFHDSRLTQVFREHDVYNDGREESLAEPRHYEQKKLIRHDVFRMTTWVDGSRLGREKGQSPESGAGSASAAGQASCPAPGTGAAQKAGQPSETDQENSLPSEAGADGTSGMDQASSPATDTGPAQKAGPQDAGRAVPAQPVPVRDIFDRCSFYIYDWIVSRYGELFRTMPAQVCTWQGDELGYHVMIAYDAARMNMAIRVRHIDLEVGGRIWYSEADLSPNGKGRLILRVSSGYAEPAPDHTASDLTATFFSYPGFYKQVVDNVGIFNGTTTSNRRRILREEQIPQLNEALRDRSRHFPVVLIISRENEEGMMDENWLGQFRVSDFTRTVWRYAHVFTCYENVGREVLREQGLPDEEDAVPRLYIFWPDGDTDSYGPSDVANCSFGRHLEARDDARTYDIVHGGQAFYHKIVADLREYNVTA